MGSGRRVLVTGAAGFLGSHIAQRFTQRGDTVVPVDGLVDNYDVAIKLGNLAEIAAAGLALGPLRQVDLRNAAETARLLAEVRPDLVVHCAALAGVQPSVEQPARYTEHNVTATVNLLEAMRDAGCCKLLFASSSSVYGADAVVPFGEDEPALHPVSPYAATKRACEILLHTYAHLHAFDYLALRFFTVYGPRQRPDLAIHRFTAAILRGEPIWMNGDGRSSRDYTHVDDVVDGVVRARDHIMERDGVREIVNLGSSSPVLLRDLIEAIEAACGVRAVVRRRPDQPGDVPRTYADVSKAAALLGYAPTRTLADGIPEFVRWWQARFLEAQAS